MHSGEFGYFICELTCFFVASMYGVQEDCDKLEKALKTRSGEEPLLVVLLNEDGSVNAAYVCGDEMKVCEASTVDRAVLYLLVIYHVIETWNYPKHYEQLLG